MARIEGSELIINPDGSIYHLNLKPGELAPIIITVGDPDRVTMVSQKFDRVELERHHREFLTHTGTYKGIRLSVISTGIGPDNIDIVFNEADALFNIDFSTRTVKDETTSLHFIRIGTSGTIREAIPLDSLLVSEAALGLDNLLQFYPYRLTGAWTGFFEAFLERWAHAGTVTTPYFAASGSQLVAAAGPHIYRGVTVTAPGFYGPQGRLLRSGGRAAFLYDCLLPFEYGGKRFTNFEMETAAMYGLAALQGHRAVSFNAILANRVTGEFSADAHAPVNRLIDEVLELIALELP